jgi:hypothetical protein
MITIILLALIWVSPMAIWAKFILTTLLVLHSACKGVEDIENED